MKLISTLIASSLALAASVQARDCTAGMNYCWGVLDDIDPRYNALMDAAIKQKYGTNWWSFVDTKDKFLYRCEPGGGISIITGCSWGCVNNGAGQSDTCRFQ
ncbi:uncharacterized protein BP01DRAFT_358973 [Aspergillus saccharolyticus JOP 1030-1]|uniref:Uncharacterized protein n=1 Tax=Aspergillus saccharolyticus JOP 1030-1 TaxID=1450539 RepID=A0A318Z7A2_9EURO|nr:hypothetical protein BP01DRAFT_358973 [Aspergillus saccharolyticus JOP 1030-1]PYH42989.1 hypothetical protein BP01DRAFT_358973 [Aspergillus saccharolyticus JOP 1030-1]